MSDSPGLRDHLRIIRENQSLVCCSNEDWTLILAMLAEQVESIGKDNTSARERILRLHEYIRGQVQPVPKTTFLDWVLNGFRFPKVGAK